MAGRPFRELDGLSPESLAVLDELKFTNATPVQEAVIPLFLGNKDVSVDACTGSGKTLAFVLPVVERLRRLEEPMGLTKLGAIIISPTRELAGQIAAVAKPFVDSVPWLRSQLLVGGSDPGADVARLRRDGGHVLIGTPGRIQDVLRRAPWLDPRGLEALVLDEADRLLDMGFKPQLDAILAQLPRQRRTGLFSATQTDAVAALARAGLRNPVRVQVSVTERDGAGQGGGGGEAGGAPQTRTPSTLSLSYAVVRPDDKLSQLCAFLADHAGEKTLVYFLTCAAVDWAAAALRSPAAARVVDGTPGGTEEAPERGAAAASAGREGPGDRPARPLPPIRSLHGKMPQRARSAAIEAWSSAPSGALLTTDLAARGLDFPDVHWVVQVDPPTEPDAFVHRVGRTARAGRPGASVAFFAPNEEAYSTFLQRRGVPLKRVRAYPTPRELDRRRRLEEEAGACGGEGGSGGAKGARGSKGAKGARAPAASAASAAAAVPPPLPTSSLPDLAQVARLAAETDRAVMESAVKAFVAHVRGYKEHSCSYIFRLPELDVGALAAGFGVLRMPAIPELKRADLSGFVPSSINPDAVRFADKAREKARIARASAEAAKRAGEAEARAEEARKKELARRDASAPGSRLTAAKRRLLAERDGDEELRREYALLRKRLRGEIDEHAYEVGTGFLRAGEKEAKREAAQAERREASEREAAGKDAAERETAEAVAVPAPGGGRPAKGAPGAPGKRGRPGAPVEPSPEEGASPGAAEPPATPSPPSGAQEPAPPLAAGPTADQVTAADAAASPASILWASKAPASLRPTRLGEAEALVLGATKRRHEKIRKKLKKKKRDAGQEA